MDLYKEYYQKNKEELILEKCKVIGQIEYYEYPKYNTFFKILIGLVLGLVLQFTPYIKTTKSALFWTCFFPGVMFILSAIFFVIYDINVAKELKGLKERLELINYVLIEKFNIK